MMAMTSGEFADAINGLRAAKMPMQPRLMPAFTRAFGAARAADHHRVMSPLWLACLRYLADGTHENRTAVQTAFTEAAMQRAREERGS